MKGVKIYTDSEIQQARSDLERKRRLFWNEKMEQPCSDPKQARHDKTTLCGMVDVSWTLRKSGMLETEANKVLYQEQVVLRGGEATTKKKLGTQKRETIPKNMDRMNAAHQQVETLDGALIKLRQNHSETSSMEQKKKIKKEFENKTALLDGAYSELKRAQEALSKSLSQKRMEMERVLASSTEDGGELDQK